MVCAEELLLLLILFFVSTDSPIFSHDNCPDYIVMSFVQGKIYSQTGKYKPKTWFLLILIVFIIQIACGMVWFCRSLCCGSYTLMFSCSLLHEQDKWEINSISSQFFVIHLEIMVYEVSFWIPVIQWGIFGSRLFYSILMNPPTWLILVKTLMAGSEWPSLLVQP